MQRSFIGLTRATGGPQEAVHAYEMRCAAGVSIVVWTYGATLVEVNLADENGQSDNVILRLPQLADYENPLTNPAYLGATLGRFSRCVSHATFAIEGEAQHLSRNLGAHHFHGGHRGFSHRVWSVQTDEEGGESVLRLSHTSSSGDEGYPGQVQATVEYRLAPDGELSITFLAVTDAPTIVGLANHAYWNLSGAGLIDRHQLQLNCANYVESDSEYIPTGRLADVTDTKLDFRMMRTLGAQALDNCFVLNDRRWCLRIEDPLSGRVMEVQTDQPALALHTGESLPLRRGGIAIQTTDFPDAPNRPEFPSAVLRPGEQYRRVTRYRFGRRACRY